LNADVLLVASPNTVPIRIVQLTDPHLFVDKAACLLGINTEDSFQSVIDLIRSEQILPHTPEANTSEHTVQLFLATGDIAQAPSSAVYQRFLATMQTLQAPYVWLQGNHDLSQIFIESGHYSAVANNNVIELGTDWVILMLNSAKDHEIAGSFSEEELAWLRLQLARYPTRHILVALHHNPLIVDSAWIDASGLSNAADFWAIIREAPQVRLVIHGHIHQEFSAIQHGVTVLGCPSTCVQFKPLSHTFTVDLLAPGYRWFDLYPDGRFESAVSRVSAMPAGIDVHSAGY
jgi:Icc protein